MGTNYYIKANECECCGHKPRNIHIGKKSYGWKFLFQRHEGLTSKAEWVEELRSDVLIEDEYGRSIQADDLIRSIEEWQSNELTGLNCHSLCGCSEDCRRWNESGGEYLDAEGYRFNASGGEFS